MWNQRNICRSESNLPEAILTWSSLAQNVEAVGIAWGKGIWGSTYTLTAGEWIPTIHPWTQNVKILFWTPQCGIVQGWRRVSYGKIHHFKNDNHTDWLRMDRLEWGEGSRSVDLGVGGLVFAVRVAGASDLHPAEAVFGIGVGVVLLCKDECDLSETSISLQLRLFYESNLEWM